MLILIRRALAQGVSDHRLFVLNATFVTSVKQLVHFSTSFQHVLNLFSNFYNFCYSCCSLFGQLLCYCSESVRTRGAVREPLGSGITPRFTFWGHLFHTQFCTLPFASKNQIFVKTCTQNGAKIH